MSITHCYIVPGDTCMSGGLCSYTHSLKGGSGWYASGCTDSTFDDPHCTGRCLDNGANGKPDVVQVSASLWACCTLTDGERNCMDPSDETFSLAASSELSSYFSIPATGYVYTSVSVSSSITVSSPTSSTSIHTVSTAPPTASKTPTSEGLNNTGRRISTATAVGMGIGISAAIFLVAALWFGLRRRHRTAEAQRPELDPNIFPEGSSPKAFSAQVMMIDQLKSPPPKPPSIS
ncbi:hypothetical protein J7T55_011765 [Diaporthe amygdali]|uniref:uncharacterized protein n=1 Tax=Phomopsis amygdali TaxID=1214568 RepID=UPI0022FE0F8B|nr:uncharacterized protein J7T55_011765 [Diaporthe amygdali]KAJ0123300.1 hypothetical protein J7T55_011765 [Diaporthe amygdali]